MQLPLFEVFLLIHLLMLLGRLVWVGTNESLLGKSNITNHFFCDLSLLLKLLDSHKLIRERVIFAFVSINRISPSGIMVVSCLYVLSQCFEDTLCTEHVQSL